MLLFRNGHTVQNPHTYCLLAHHQVAFLKTADTIAHTLLVTLRVAHSACHGISWLSLARCAISNLDRRDESRKAAQALRVADV